MNKHLAIQHVHVHLLHNMLEDERRILSSFTDASRLADNMTNKDQTCSRSSQRRSAGAHACACFAAVVLAGVSASCITYAPHATTNINDRTVRGLIGRGRVGDVHLLSYFQNHKALPAPCTTKALVEGMNTLFETSYTPMASCQARLQQPQGASAEFKDSGFRFRVKELRCADSSCKFKAKGVRFEDSDKSSELGI